MGNFLPAVSLQIRECLQRTVGLVDNNALDNSRHLKRIIEWANDYKLPEFRYYDAVPRDLSRLNNLRYLLVKNNHGITEIPDALAYLPFLQGICLENNQIRSIPVALYKCPSLQRIDLRNNHITRIEDGIHALRNVYTIDLSGNMIEHVTPDIAKMKSLQKLDIRNQRTPICFTRASDTPLSIRSRDALLHLRRRIDVQY